MANKQLKDVLCQCLKSGGRREEVVNSPRVKGKRERARMGGTEWGLSHWVWTSSRQRYRVICCEWSLAVKDCRGRDGSYTHTRTDTHTHTHTCISVMYPEHGASGVPIRAPPFIFL